MKGKDSLVQCALKTRNINIYIRKLDAVMSLAGMVIYAVYCDSIYSASLTINWYCASATISNV